MKKRNGKYIFILGLFIFLFMNPVVSEAKTVTVTTAKELKDNLPFTTNDVTDIVLGADIYTTDTMAFYFTKDSSLDLNGHTLTINSSYDFTVKNLCRGCTMTFKDTSDNKDGKLVMMQNQIYVSPADGNCLTTNVVINGGNYEQASSNNEYSLFKLYKNGNCSSYNTTENLTIENGDFKANIIFFADSKTANVKIEALRMTRARDSGDLVLGSFNNIDALDTFENVVDSNSEVLYDGVVKTDLTKKIDDESAENTIVVRRKTDLKMYDLKFDDLEVGYSNVVSKSIVLENVGLNDIEIKSIFVDKPDWFSVIGNTNPIILVGSTNDESFSIKPVVGLSVGSYETVLTVVDQNNKKYTSVISMDVIEKSNDNQGSGNNNDSSDNQDSGNNNDSDNNQEPGNDNDSNNNQEPGNDNDSNNNQEPGNDNGQNDSQESDNKNNSNVNDNVNNPSTSDNITKYIIMLSVSIIGLSIIGVVGKYKSLNK